MKISPGLTNHAALLGVTPDQHHAMLHAIDSALVHSGVITDLQHGVRTLVNAHAHGSLSGVTANQHHAEAHTLASHTTKTHAELTGIGPSDHHPAVKAIWAQPHTVSGTGAVLAASYMYYAGAEFANGQTDVAFFTIPVPTGFSALTKAVIRMFALGTGNVYLRLDSYFAAVGEAYNIHSVGIDYAAKAVVALQMAEYNISAALAAIAAGDTVGIAIRRDATNALDTSEDKLYVLGVLLEYT